MQYAWWQLILIGYILGSAVTTLCVWLNERADQVGFGAEKENAPDDGDASEPERQFPSKENQQS